MRTVGPEVARSFHHQQNSNNKNNKNNNNSSSDHDDVNLFSLLISRHSMGRTCAAGDRAGRVD